MTELREQLLRAVFASYSYTQIESALREVPELEGEFPVKGFTARLRTLWGSSPSQLFGFLASFPNSYDRCLFQAELVCMVRWHGSALTVKFLEELERLDLAPRERELLAAMRVHAHVRSGDLAGATSAGVGLPSSAPPDDVFGLQIAAFSQRNVGLLQQVRGDYERARISLERSLALCSTGSLLFELNAAQDLAFLYWASGQFQQALEIHQDPVRRRRASDQGHDRFLVKSHLNAAKCAIDLKATSKAQAELAQAWRIIDRHFGAKSLYAAYGQLYEGEVLVQLGRFEDALKLIQAAQASFERLDPPHYPGALDAKIAQAHFCLYEGDHKTAFAIIRKLLEEAEERNCMDARSRLLVLETFLYLNGASTVTEGYQDLVARVHLINNPALLIRALGNLYTYALEYLEETEQAFLLSRIRNLRPVLEQSCFDDLYRSYVTERYAYAIENRLARLSDTELDELFEPEGSDDSTSGGSALGDSDPRDRD